MRILLVAQCFPPENVGPAVWIHQLATGLLARGHKVTMTAFPNHPGRVVFKPYRGKLVQREAKILMVMKSAPAVLNIQDIFPEVAVSLGYLKSRSAVSFFGVLERALNSQSKPIVARAALLGARWVAARKNSLHHWLKHLIRSFLCRYIDAVVALNKLGKLTSQALTAL